MAAGVAEASAGVSGAGGALAQPPSIPAKTPARAAIAIDLENESMFLPPF
jgi:hypothetical protein